MVIRNYYLIFLFIFLIIFSGCSSLASLDRNLMQISNSVSSYDPVTGKRELVAENTQKEINRAIEEKNKLLNNYKQKKIKIDKKTKYYGRVVKVFNKLKHVVHRKDLPWEVHVIDSKDWNAFTIGGGKVFVYSGIFQGKAAIKSDDELAAILAHEMAHNAARHTTEARNKIMLTKLLNKSVRKERIYDASFIMNQEDEADKISTIYMALAGYNPSAAVNIWQRMDRIYGNDKGDLLYDHPLNKDRIKNLKYYSSQAKKYYIPNKINPEHKKILKQNSLFSNNNIISKVEAGKGGGILSLIEVIANTRLEMLKAKEEMKKRKNAK